MAALAQLESQIKFDGVVTALAALTPGGMAPDELAVALQQLPLNCRVLHARRPTSRQLNKRFRRSRTNERRCSYWESLWLRSSYSFCQQITGGLSGLAEPGGESSIFPVHPIQAGLQSSCYPRRIDDA